MSGDRLPKTLLCNLWATAYVAALATGAFSTPCLAGHSRFPYCDGGQPADGRFVVTPKLIETPAAKKVQAAEYYWEYTWLDRKENRSLTGKLAGLRSGTSSVFDPVHAHIFVAPGGETFAVWNPNVMAPTATTNQKWPDLATASAREWEGFTHRLTVYRNSGELVKRLDLKDFLLERDWHWLLCYGRQVYWQSGYPPLTRDNAPRVGYALFRISPDYTVLETMVGATQEAIHKAKEHGIIPPPPRLVRVELTSGNILDPREPIGDRNKQPTRAFVGAPIQKGGRGKMETYEPSLDPVRKEGRFVEVSQ